MIKEKIRHNFFFLLTAAVAAGALFVLSPYVDVLFLAVVFALLFGPMHRRIERAFGERKFIAALVSTTAVALVVLVPVVALGYKIFVEATDIYLSFGGAGTGTPLVGVVTDVVARYYPALAPVVSADLGRYAGNGLQWLMTHLGTVFSSIASLTVNFFLVLFAMFYLFRDGAVFRRMAASLSPLQDEHNQELFDRVGHAIVSVVRGTLVVALAQGVLAGIGLAFAGIPSPAVWGSVSAFAALIPGIGTALVLGPAAVYLAMVGQMGMAIALAAWGFIIIANVDTFIRPAMIGKSVKIHPVLVLFSALGGLQVMGFIGFLIGPIVLAVLFALFEMYPKIVANHAEY